ncbi:hypothetical protein IRJ41_013250 [Triplophysa rosa]|uniref:Secreted protein n=1 Tax=Triplophysa rosa TaxID=992332 RepID=A0A9W7TU68_TRIRA|nr:hypothetical protein IRJ41_013250 [Triplophysa rosa]
MIAELVCSAVALVLYVNTLDADFCYDDRCLLIVVSIVQMAPRLKSRDRDLSILLVNRGGRSLNCQQLDYWSTALSGQAEIGWPSSHPIGSLREYFSLCDCQGR